MATTGWQETVDGFAVGPAFELDNGDGTATSVRTFWTDEDGVTVSVDGGDGMMPAARLAALIALLGEVANLRGPAPVSDARP